MHARIYFIGTPGWRQIAVAFFIAYLYFLDEFDLVTHVIDLKEVVQQYQASQ